MPECKNCKKEFNFVEAELKFYKKIGVDEPRFCPTCRQLFRYAIRNEDCLYNRKCDSCGRQTFSFYSADKPYPVYCLDCFWKDSWNGVDYGIDYDRTKSVFEHMEILHTRVPHQAIQIVNSKNSDYTNSCASNIDCYFTFRTHYSERIFYSYWMMFDKDCVDCLKCTKCELLYQCTEAHNSYNCRYSYNISDCLDSSFCVDCRSCQSCYLCNNLRNRKFCYKNQQLTEEEYKNKVTSIGDRREVEKFKKEFKEIKNCAIYRATNTLNCYNCFGDNMVNCKNCYPDYDMVGCEDCLYSTDAVEAKDCVDASGFGPGVELVYNCVAHTNVVNAICCWDLKEGCRDMQYSFHCFGCHDCFGCLSLKNSSFCIFNKKYPEEGYYKLLKEIIDKMKEEKNYGQYFTPKYSAFAYNETPAQFYFPLTKEEVIRCGWKWKDKEEREYEKSNYVVPDDINKIGDDIIKETLSCVECGRNYKIIKQELSFYRERVVPVPDRCYYCRHKERFLERNPRSLRKTDCFKCKKEIDTAIPEDWQRKIYCENCYQKEIY